MIDAGRLGKWMGFLPRLLDRWRIIAAAFACVGLLHIGTTFAVPHFTAGNAYDRLRQVLPVNQMLFLPALTPENQPLPFMGADSLYALCRFDTRKSPVYVRAVLPGAGWSLTVHTRTGANLYTAAGQDERPITLELKLVPSEARFSGLTPEALGIASRRVEYQRVESSRGIAIVRAPDRGLAHRRDAEINIEKSTCYALDN